MDEQIEKVSQFHKVFHVPIAPAPTAEISAETAAWRLRLHAEELKEYQKALEDKDIVGIADALTDMLYVLLGTFLAHGLQDIASDLFEEVHRSNMSKLDENGKPMFREDGKIAKLSSFSEPDLEPIIRRME